MIDATDGLTDYPGSWEPTADEAQQAAEQIFDVTFGISTEGGKLTFTMDDKGSGAVRHAKGENPALVVPLGSIRTFLLRLSEDLAWEYDPDPALKGKPARFKKSADTPFYDVEGIDARTVSIKARSTDSRDPAGIKHNFNLYVTLAQASGKAVAVRIDPIADNPPPTDDGP